MSTEALPCTLFLTLYEDAAFPPESRLHPISPPLYGMECVVFVLLRLLEEFSTSSVCCVQT